MITIRIIIYYNDCNVYDINNFGDDANNNNNPKNNIKNTNKFYLQIKKIKKKSALSQSSMDWVLLDGKINNSLNLF